MTTFRFQLRRGTAAEWVTANPVLSAGEPGVDLDTGEQRIGDGATAWADLPIIGDLTPAMNAVSAETAARGVALTEERDESEARYVRKLKGLTPGIGTAPVKAANAALLAAAMTPGASVIIPAGDYYTDEVAITGPVTITGEGITTTLRNDTGSVLVVSGSQVNVSTLTMRSGGGNHTIRQTGGVDQGHWDRVRLYQGSPSYSVWDNAGHGFIDMRFTNFLSWHIQTATVPTWKIAAAGGLVNNNVWSQFRAQFSGNYHFWVESTNVNTQHANVWRDATWEVTTGGMVKMIGCRDYIIDNSTVWDLAAGVGVVTLTRDGILADTNGAGALCIGTIRNHKRLDGSLTGGAVDIKLPSGTGKGAGTVIERCQNISSGNPLVIDLNSNDALVVNPGSAASTLTTYSNATASQFINKDGITLPAAQSFKIGTNTVVGLGLLAGVPADPASIPANSELDVALTVTGAVVGDACTVSTGSALEAGLGIVGCWATANTVTFRLRNFTGSAIDPIARTWRVRVWR